MVRESDRSPSQTSALPPAWMCLVALCLWPSAGAGASSHSPALSHPAFAPPPPPCSHSAAWAAWPRVGKAARRAGVLSLRGGLEDRERDVQSVREGARGLLSELMRAASVRAAKNAENAAPEQAPSGMKSATSDLSDAIDVTQDSIKLGFVGTGTIVSHTVKGLLRPGLEGKALDVTISPRSKDRAAELKSLFPDQVTVAADNQAVLDASSIVCLGVTPQMAEGVLSELKFREDHVVVSFLSTAKIPDIARMCAPAKTILRAIPMPPIEKGLGPLVTHPPNDAFNEIFSRTGKIIALENESECAAMMSTSALMATYYEWEGVAHKFLVAQGVPSKAATSYVCSLFLALATKGQYEEDGFDKIVSESQTPGGINEQVVRNLRAEGWFEAVGKQLDMVLARVLGKPKA